MFVCLHGINTRTWQLHAYGQSLVRYYGGSAMVAIQTEQHPPGQQFQAPPPVSIIRQLGLQRGRGKKEQQTGAGKEQVLHIAFQKRDGTVRQLLNAAELIERCNAWRYTTQAGAQLRALCWEVSISAAEACLRGVGQLEGMPVPERNLLASCVQVEMPSLKAGIAAAQLADIFVGPHGANIANAWLMRPGSSVVEVTMFGFDESVAHINLAARNAKVGVVAVAIGRPVLAPPYTLPATDVFAPHLPRPLPSPALCPPAGHCH